MVAQHVIAIPVVHYRPLVMTSPETAHVARALMHADVTRHRKDSMCLNMIIWRLKQNFRVLQR